MGTPQNFSRETEEALEAPNLSSPTLPLPPRGDHCDGEGSQPPLMPSFLPLAGTSLAQPCSWAGRPPAWPCWGAPSCAARAQSLRGPAAAHSLTGPAPRLQPESTSEPRLCRPLQHPRQGQ